MQLYVDQPMIWYMHSLVVPMIHSRKKIHKDQRIVSSSLTSSVQAMSILPFVSTEIRMCLLSICKRLSERRMMRCLVGWMLLFNSRSRVSTRETMGMEEQGKWEWNWTLCWTRPNSFIADVGRTSRRRWKERFSQIIAEFHLLHPWWSMFLAFVSLVLPIDSHPQFVLQRFIAWHPCWSMILPFNCCTNPGSISTGTPCGVSITIVSPFAGLKQGISKIDD